MKAKEALARLNSVYPNPLDKDEQMHALNELERMIYDEVVLDYEPVNPDFDSTIGVRDDDTLLASGTYEELYVHWLTAQMAYALHEYEQYTSSMQMFNSYYEKFVRKYAKAHRVRDTYSFTGF